MYAIGIARFRCVVTILQGNSMKKDLKKALFSLAIVAAFGTPVLTGARAMAADDMKKETAAVSDELKDGTKIEMKGSEVFLIGKDGASIPAPDGTHTLASGKEITTKDGKVVN